MVRDILGGRTSGRVLVIDNDDDVRHVLRETLQRLGCDVSEAIRRTDRRSRRLGATSSTWCSWTSTSRTCTVTM
jgi:hypothetical protein